MCVGPFAPKKQQPQVVKPEPVVVAPPPEPTPEPAAVADDDSLSRKSQGTRSLRIALNIAGPSGRGINVPGGA